MTRNDALVAAAAAVIEAAQQPAAEAAPASLLTAQELADHLRVPLSWVHDNVRRRGIPHFKVGRHLRFRLHEVEDWIEHHRAEAS